MSDDLYQNALKRLISLIEEGKSRGLQEVDAAALATADSAARPSLRMVNILAIEPEGLVFFAKRESGKSQQLLENPRACLCFFWPVLQEQVIIEGDVTLEDASAADRYWEKMPRERQVFTWVAAQIAPSQQRGALRNTMKEHWSDTGFESIRRHADWAAFRLQPDRIEFWPFGWRRAQERVLYSHSSDGDWSRKLIVP